MSVIADALWNSSNNSLFFLNRSFLSGFVCGTPLSTVQSPAFTHILSSRVHIDDSSREKNDIGHDYGGMSSRGLVIFDDIK